MLSCAILGYLGSDAVIREKDGVKYAFFKVAHSVKNSPDSGERERPVIWGEIYWFDFNQELFSRLKKWSYVFVRGYQSLQIEIDKSGIPQIQLSICAQEVVSYTPFSRKDQ